MRGRNGSASWPRHNGVNWLLAGGLDAHDAARRMADEERLAVANIPEPTADPFEIVADGWHDVGVDDRRTCAFVFAPLPYKHMRQRYRGFGIFGREDLANALLMGRIGIGMQQTHRDRVDAGLPKSSDASADILFNERLDYGAGRIQPLSYF